MEFFEGFLSSQQSSRLNRLTLRFTPERSCWASLPPAVISQIYALGYEVPLVLQLQLSHPSATQFYRHVAWAGAGSVGGLTLEMSTALGQSLGLEEGQVLQVQALPDVPLATSVTVEPADSDDWEILEHNAEYLEQHLLNQVGVVCRGQTFPFWVHHHTVICLRATATSPADVVRLARGVELLVAPKPRRTSLHVPDVDTTITPSATPTGPNSLSTPMKPPLPKDAAKATEAPTRSATLRVADASNKWLLPLDSSGQPVNGRKPSGAHDPSSVSSSTPAAYSWLTTAAVIAPETAVATQLAPGYPALLCAKPGHPIKQVAVMLLIDPSVCAGHIMLTPPLQQAIGALPHTHIKLLQPVVQPALLPSVPPTHLHPLSLDLHPSGPSSAHPPGANGPAAGNMPRSDSGGARSSAGETDTSSTEAAAVAATAAAFSNKDVSAAVQLALSESIHGAFCGWLHSQLAAIQAAATTLETWLQSSPDTVPHLPFGNMQPQSATAAPLSAVPLAVGSIMHVTTRTKPTLSLSSHKKLGIKMSDSSLEASAGGSRAGPASSTSGSCTDLQQRPSIDVGVPLVRGQSGGAGRAQSTPGDVLAGLGVRELCGFGGEEGVDQCFLVRLQSGAAAGAAGSGLGISLVTAATLRQQMRNSARSPTGAAGTTQLKPAINLTTTRYSSSPHRAFLQDSSTAPTSLDDAEWLRTPLTACLERVCAITGTAPWAPQPWPQQVPRPGGLLLSAASGAGKTLLMRILGHLMRHHPCHQAHVIHVDCKRLAGNTPTKTNTILQSIFAEALQCWPSVVVLDDLDLLCPATGDGPDAATPWTAAALAQWLASMLDMLTLQGKLVACVATCTSAASIPATLRRSGRLDFEVKLPPPGMEGRADMLATSLKQLGCKIPADQLQDIVVRAEGYDAGDMHTLVQRAMHAALARQISAPGSDQLIAAAGVGLHLTSEDLKSALEDFEPAAFWGLQSTKGTSDTQLDGWEDVGGLPQVREVLYEALELPLRFPNLVAAAPLRLRTGLLLYGPPGCGKTHVVNAAIAATGVRFISVKGPELLNKYIGASEAAVRAVFQRASAAAPCVLFFDEMDSIAPPRGHDSTGVTDRVVNQLLTELDGVEGLKGVCVIGATSRPDLIDAALLRPGRLDRQVYCGFPDRVARLQILQALTRNLKKSEDVDLSWIASNSEGLTGADLGAVFSAAQLAAVHKVLEKDSLAGGSAGAPEVPVISMADVQDALRTTRPSVPRSERTRLEGIYQTFQQLQDPAAGQVDVKGKGKKVTLA